jgi:hypothetical protein
MLPNVREPPNIEEITDGEAFDSFVLWSAAGTVGTANWFSVAAAMLVATVVSVHVSYNSLCTE